MIIQPQDNFDYLDWQFPPLRLQDYITYLANDTRCMAAIKDINDGMDTLKWLGVNLDLYVNVTYAPDDHSRVADCNYNGAFFRNIAEFAEMYLKKHHEVEDPFSGPF